MTVSRQYGVSLFTFFCIFAIGLATFSVEESSWWEPSVGAGFVALTFGVFVFYAMRYPRYLILFWTVLFLGLTLLYTQFSTTECVTEDYCTSSPLFLAALNGTFFIDLVLLVMFIPGVLIPYLAKRVSNMYVVFGVLGVMFSGAMLYAYLTIDSLAMNTYHGVVLSGIGVGYGSLLLAGLRGGTCNAWLEQRKKWIAAFLLVSVLLLASTIPFAE